jgi:hypothetical protein
VRISFRYISNVRRSPREKRNLSVNIVISGKVDDPTTSFRQAKYFPLSAPSLCQPDLSSKISCTLDIIEIEPGDVPATSHIGQGNHKDRLKEFKMVIGDVTNPKIMQKAQSYVVIGLRTNLNIYFT